MRPGLRERTEAALVSCSIITHIDTLTVEVSMAHPRTANRNALFVFLAVVAFLISGIVAASPNPSAQQGHLIPPQPSAAFRVEVLSALPEGVDFEPYLRNLDASIVFNLHANLPKSAAHGEKGVVLIQVRFPSIWPASIGGGAHISANAFTRILPRSGIAARVAAFVYLSEWAL